MTVAWLIEYRDPRTGNCTGYVRDIATAGTFDVCLTKDPNRALKFATRAAAQTILDNPNFVHAMGSNPPLAIAEHAWMDGPADKTNGGL
jgi:hypothetical protein